jgi:acyl carrier protein
MEDSSRKICRTVKEYIMSEFLPGEDQETLSDDTPLITSGILDSIQITKLVIFLEETYGLEFQINEITAGNIDTLESIAQIVQMKNKKDA